MELVTCVQILNKAVSISFCAYALGKVINPSLLHQLWLHSRADQVQPISGKENSEFKQAKIVLVSHPVHEQNSWVNTNILQRLH